MNNAWGYVSPDLPLNTVATIEFWVYFTSSGDFFSKYADLNNSYYFVNNGTNDGTSYYNGVDTIDFAGFGVYAQHYYVTNVLPNRWNHIALCYQTNKTVNAFVNGIKVLSNGSLDTPTVAPYASVFNGFYFNNNGTGASFKIFNLKITNNFQYINNFTPTILNSSVPDGATLKLFAFCSIKNLPKYFISSGNANVQQFQNFNSVTFEKIDISNTFYGVSLPSGDVNNINTGLFLTTNTNNYGPKFVGDGSTINAIAVNLSSVIANNTTDSLILNISAFGKAVQTEYFPISCFTNYDARYNFFSDAPANWQILKFSNGGYTINNGISARISLASTSNNVISLVGDPSNYNFNKFIIASAYYLPEFYDDIHISSSIYSNTTQVRNITASSNTFNNIFIHNKGNLTFPILTSTNLSLFGSVGLQITSEGTLKIDQRSLTPLNTKHTITLANNFIDVHDGGNLNLYGYEKVTSTYILSGLTKSNNYPFSFQTPAGAITFTTIDNLSTWFADDNIYFTPYFNESSSTDDILIISSLTGNSFTTASPTTLDHLTLQNLPYVPSIANFSKSINILGLNANNTFKIRSLHKNSNINISHTYFKNFGGENTNSIWSLYDSTWSSSTFNSTVSTTFIKKFNSNSYYNGNINLENNIIDYNNNKAFSLPSCEFNPKGIIANGNGLFFIDTIAFASNVNSLNQGTNGSWTNYYYFSFIPETTENYTFYSNADDQSYYYIYYNNRLYSTSNNNNVTIPMSTNTIAVFRIVYGNTGGPGNFNTVYYNTPSLGNINLDINNSSSICLLPNTNKISNVNFNNNIIYRNPNGRSDYYNLSSNYFKFTNNKIIKSGLYINSLSGYNNISNNITICSILNGFYINKTNLLSDEGNHTSYNCYLYGYYINDNCFKKPFSLTNVNSINSYLNDGIYIKSNTNIIDKLSIINCCSNNNYTGGIKIIGNTNLIDLYINNLTANNNNGYGVYITGDSTTITPYKYSGTFINCNINNNNTGLTIPIVNGTLNFNNVVANNNKSDGIYNLTNIISTTKYYYVDLSIDGLTANNNTNAALNFNNINSFYLNNLYLTGNNIGINLKNSGNNSDQVINSNLSNITLNSNSTAINLTNLNTSNYFNVTNLTANNNNKILNIIQNFSDSYLSPPIGTYITENPNIDSGSSAGTYTLEMWINFSTGGYFLGAYVNGALGFSIFYNGADTLSVRFNGNATSCTLTNILLNTWNHLAFCVKPGSPNPTISIFVNGIAKVVDQSYVSSTSFYSVGLFGLQRGGGSGASGRVAFLKWTDNFTYNNSGFVPNNYLDNTTITGTVKLYAFYNKISNAYLGTGGSIGVTDLTKYVFEFYGIGINSNVLNGVDLNLKNIYLNNNSTCLDIQNLGVLSANNLIINNTNVYVFNLSSNLFPNNNIAISNSQFNNNNGNVFNNASVTSNINSLYLNNITFSANKGIFNPNFGNIYINSLTSINNTGGVVLNGSSNNLNNIKNINNSSFISNSGIGLDINNMYGVINYVNNNSLNNTIGLRVSGIYTKYNSTLLNISSSILSGNTDTGLAGYNFTGSITNTLINDNFKNNIIGSIIDGSLIIDGLTSYNRNATFDKVTQSNGPNISNFTPFPDFSDGSIYLNGSQGLVFPPNTDYVMNGDFTIEFFVYPIRTSSVTYFDNEWNALGGQGSWQISCDTNSYLRFYYDGINYIQGLSTMNSNTWYHIAAVRNNNRLTLFMNGLSTAGINYTGTVGKNTNLTFGYKTQYGPILYCNSYISNIRITNNTCLYKTTSFTVPTTKFTALTSTTSLFYQYPYGVDYIKNITINTKSNIVLSGINYNQIYIKNSILNISPFNYSNPPSIVLDGVNFKQFYVDSSNFGSFGLSPRAITYGSYYVNNSNLNNFGVQYGLQSNYQPYAIKSSGFAFTSYNKSANYHVNYFAHGTRSSDSLIYNDTGSSERLTPNSSTFKLRSGSKFVALIKNNTTRVTVTVRKSTVNSNGVKYNGNDPRLMLRRNVQMGIMDDIILGSYTGTSENFIPISAETPVVIDSGVLEFYIDCDGTQGWINIDSWSAI